jgi:hypothetical protein
LRFPLSESNWDVERIVALELELIWTIHRLNDGTTDNFMFGAAAGKLYAAEASHQRAISLPALVHLT